MPAEQIWLRASAGRAAATLDLFLWGIFLCGFSKTKTGGADRDRCDHDRSGGHDAALAGSITNAAPVVKSDVTDQMTDAVESRAAVIDEYVLSAEEYMTAFALGSEVHDLLRDPDDPALLARAQEYTEDFAAVKGVFEGLYIAAPDTHVRTHTSQGAIGMTTRSGDPLKTLQDTILAQQQLTDLGIMKSPGTGSMILSMYCPIFEGRRCIG